MLWFFYFFRSFVDSFSIFEPMSNFDVTVNQNYKKNYKIIETVLQNYKTIARILKALLRTLFEPTARPGEFKGETSLPLNWTDCSLSPSASLYWLPNKPLIKTY